MKTLLVTLALVATSIWAPPASAWYIDFNLYFQNQWARSTVTVFSSGSESADYDHAKCQARIYEENLFVRGSGTLEVDRWLQNDLRCFEIAIDYGLSVGCTYCNDTQISPTGQHKGSLWEEGTKEQEKTSTTVNYCEIWDPPATPINIVISQFFPSM